jgi:hypothetical protein
MSTQTLPAALAVRNMLEDLLGREVTVNPANAVVAKDVPTTLLALYVDSANRLAAVLGLDLALAAYTGAALGLLPVGGAQDSIEDRGLTPMLAENVRELCNVLTGLLNKEGAPHLKLHQVYLPGEQPPSDAVAYLLALGRRVDLEVAVARYGSGRFSLSLTN